MPRAIHTQDLPSFQVRKNKIAGARRRDIKIKDKIKENKKAFSGKRYEDLKTSEKDELLKMISIRLGLIRPD